MGMTIEYFLWWSKTLAVPGSLHCSLSCGLAILSFGAETFSVDLSFGSCLVLKSGSGFDPRHKQKYGLDSCGASFNGAGM